MNEFEIIQQYFQNSRNFPIKSKQVFLGSGDDCAILKIPPNQLLAVSIDTLISGVHFPKDFKPYDIGYKSLAVNLSDLAAMGAEPAWFTCAVSLVNNQKKWLSEFAQGLADCAKKYKVVLVGGDITKSKILSISISINGLINPHQILKRSGAKVGDAIYISGKLGVAHAKKYYYRPEPKINLGLALRGKAHSAIDISDGLVADLSHILDASKVGASLYLDKIPLVSPAGLVSGDDYELCFTGPANLKIKGHKIYCIGKIESQKGLRIYNKNGSLYKIKNMGYRHF